MSSQGFDPNRSRVSDTQLAEFLAGEIVEDIQSVPGIGPKAAQRLAEEVEGDQPIQTTHQLIGKFLSLRGPGMNQHQHCDAMWYYLKVCFYKVDISCIINNFMSSFVKWIHIVLVLYLVSLRRLIC